MALMINELVNRPASETANIVSVNNPQDEIVSDFQNLLSQAITKSGKDRHNALQELLIVAGQKLSQLDTEMKQGEGNTPEEVEMKSIIQEEVRAVVGNQLSDLAKQIQSLTGIVANLAQRPVTMGSAIQAIPIGKAIVSGQPEIQPRKLSSISDIVKKTVYAPIGYNNP
jgi:membrane protease subunit (stomatin/prohibitin family)